VKVPTGSIKGEVHWSSTTQAAEVALKTAMTQDDFGRCNVLPRNHAKLCALKHDLFSEPSVAARAVAGLDRCVAIGIVICK
jgi:hypothetical protein